MKVRAQRTHFMGSSNRNKNTYDASSKTQSIFERSFNKNKSLTFKPSDNKSMVVEREREKVKQIGAARRNPFQGSHNEF